MPDGLTNILVVDDDVMLLDLFELALKTHNAGFQVDMAATGEECLKKLSGHKYDLIILDYNLPKMSGLEILDEIKQRGMDTPVIIVTGASKESVAVDAMKKGAADYLSKEGEFIKILPTMVDRVLNESRSKRNLQDAYATFQKMLGSSHNLKELLPLILKLTGAISKADSGSLMLLDEETSQLTTNASFGLSVKDVETIRVKLGERIPGFLAGNGQSGVITGGLEKTPGFEHLETRPEIKSALCVLLRAKGQVLGIINLNSTHSSGRVFENENFDFLMEFAGNAAIAIQNVQFYEKLTRLQTKMVQSEKMAAVGQIAAAIAHQLNSPLAGIASVTGVVKKRLKGDDANYNMLNEVNSAAVFCGKVIRELLIFSRKSTGTPVPVDCNQAIEGVLTFSAHQLQTRAIQIVKKLSPDLRPVMGYMSELQQVFLNMISNARDAMPKGGNFTITTSMEEDGSRVEIRFNDTGTGISPDNMKTIFEPFFTTKKSGEGTGLGLPICADIIKKHHGEIKVASKNGSGTMFVISLPAKEEK